MSTLRWVFTRISKTRAWVWFSRKILSKWTLRVMGYPETALSKYGEICTVIDTWMDGGAIAFVSCDRATPVAKLIRWITGDRFSHAGMVLTKTGIYDARSGGVQYRNLLEMIGQADDFALVRFEFINAETEREFYEDIQKYLGRGYDFAQELGGQNLYCSELVYTLLQGRVVEDLHPRRFHGQLGFSPGDVYNGGKVIFDHNPTR